MLSECLWLVFMMSSFTISDISMPEFSQKVPMATISNVYCQSVKIPQTKGALNSSEWSFSLLGQTRVICAVDLSAPLVSTRLTTEVHVDPGEVALVKDASDKCGQSNIRTVDRRCQLKIHVVNAEMNPKRIILGWVISWFKGTIESKIEEAVCNEGLPQAEKLFLDPAIRPMSPHPKLESEATPLHVSPLLRSVVRVVNVLPEILNLTFSASMHADTTIRLQIVFVKGTHISFGKETSTATISVDFILKKVMDLLNALNLDSIREMLSKALLEVPKLSVEGGVPHAFGASIDFNLHDFRCEPDGVHCSLPQTNGISLQNIRTEQLGEWDRLIANHADPFANIIFEKILNATITDLNRVERNRLIFPPGSVHEKQLYPSTLLSVSIILGGALFLGIAIFFSVRRHRQNPVKDLNGGPLSMKRIIIEDTILILMAIASTYLFAASNATTAATLVVGEEFEMLAFSLMETVENLYKAGLSFLAVLVFIFSGVYPYLKIVTVLVWTLVLQRPGSPVLVVVDYFGKFSFLDSFAMVIMAGGLQMVGIAEVSILPGFYMFLGATVLSILAGNFATALWRRNTSLRSCGNPNEPTKFRDDGDRILNRSAAVHISSERRVFFTPKRAILAVFNGIFVAVCVILPWVYPCLKYRVIGLAALIQPDDREMTLYQLSSISWILIITCLVTLVVTPILFALLYPYCSLLASWSAGDALLLACVAGLLQLGQFVEFVMGPGTESIYQAEALLLWPLIPMAVANVWQWILALEHLTGCMGKIKQCLRR